VRRSRCVWGRVECERCGELERSPMFVLSHLDVEVLEKVCEARPGSRRLEDGKPEAA
jgi:hypothetical protein